MNEHEKNEKHTDSHEHTEHKTHTVHAEPVTEHAEHILHITNEEKRLATLTHMLSLTGFIIPLGNIIGPLIMYFIRKDNQKFLEKNAKACLNFQISMTIYYLIAGVLCIVLIGFVILPILAVISIIYSILAALRSNEGKTFEYPFSFEFIK